MDYYGNYENNLQLTLEMNDEQVVSYRTNGWPLLELNLDQVNHPLPNKASIKLRFSKGDNTLPLIYLSNAYTYGEYSPTKNLHHQQGKVRFIEQSFTNEWTAKPLHLAIPIS